MKLLVALSALFVAINALSDHALWSEFKVTHSKKYQDIREEQLRFQIFQNNLKRIEEHNAKYDKGEVSYSFGVNKFADMTSEEFMAMLNNQISSKPKLNATRFEHENVKAPDAIDWRDKSVVLVKDQGNCGSCWAFSTTGALEGQLSIKQNKNAALSEQELVDCSTENAGCNGGDMGLAFEYVEKNGLSSEESYSYTGEDGQCKSGTKVLKSISGYKNVDQSEKALQAAVGTEGPISVAVNANAEWQLYRSGVFDHFLCLGLTLNHGVLAVGYGTENNKNYWIIRNSWGTSWGEDGYIRLVRGKNQCGIAKDASYPEL